MRRKNWRLVLECQRVANKRIKDTACSDGAAERRATLCRKTERRRLNVEELQRRVTECGTPKRRNQNQMVNNFVS